MRKGFEEICLTGKVFQRLHGLLDQLKVAYVDLFAAFSQVDETLYFAHDSHWNSKGAALGADLINRAGYRDCVTQSRYYTFKILAPAAAA